MSSETQLRLSRLSKYSASPCTRLESLAREQTEAALNAIIQVMEKTQDERMRLMYVASAVQTMLG